MEVWDVRGCDFCDGTGFNVPRIVYDRRKKILKDVQLKIAAGKSPMLFWAAFSGLKQKAKQYPPCSFCDGKGVFKTREPDR